MAKYAQGYERKNSDSKNLIIMISVIVAVVVVAIVVVILCNKFVKRENKNYSTFKADETYSAYYLTDYSKLLGQDEENYCIYVISSSQTSDKNMKAVIKYLEDFESGNISVKLYLLDYDDFDNTSDETEKANASKVTEALGDIQVQAGYFLAIYNNKIANKATQVITKAETVEKIINSLSKNDEALEFNK